MRTRSFPEVFPIFPLPGVVLFPSRTLPLHIFEPRYREMIDVVIRGDGVLGMVLVKPGCDPMHEKADIFDVGCAGMVRRADRTEDGRYYIVLEGVHRFRIRKERPLTVARYRVAETELLSEAPFDSLGAREQETLCRKTEVVSATLLGVLDQTQPGHGAELSRWLQTMDPVELSYLLPTKIDCSAIERQAFLEATGAFDRLDQLQRYLQIGLAEARLARDDEPTVH